ncbi:MotA/TolQ/ExbB proton channel family protein [Panacagrimonas perspica]|uniref:MotA/TolQ/ExbB proton channel family protein n=1 Tax=Panacagrimonas perspica TaxID=381431 RepID=A0A4R7NZF9_9GAMM|nr:MotA/TolQ/ExbB proton channel family protein [Panacagrimonas perspica]TDU26754.1 MotA/TolQ/ExbB proton channel family protein [Panacagrimonas perspica]
MNRSRATLSAELLGEVEGSSFLYWFVLSAACVFGVHMSWTLGLLQQVLIADTTQISASIVLIYFGCMAYGGWRAYQLSSAHCGLDRMRAHFRSSGELPSASGRLEEWSHEYCSGLLEAAADRAALREVLEERARGAHEAGWFLSSMILKLGLLGTIVGFVFMLGAIDAIKTLTTADLPQMLGKMGAGMAISLYTTLVGLVANMALGLQNLMLDRSAERLVSGTMQFAEREMLPALAGNVAP